MKWHRLSISKEEFSHYRKLFRQRFTKRANGCWEWDSKSPFEYGRFCFRKKSHAAHRIAFAAFKGPIPPRMCVCHKCDNPRCVRPAHLALGTHRHNTEDRIRKGRHHKGRNWKLRPSPAKRRGIELKNRMHHACLTESEKQRWISLCSKIGKRSSAAIRLAMIEMMDRHGIK